VLDLLRHFRDLLEHRTERLGQTWREHGHASLAKQSVDEYDGSGHEPSNLFRS
jgi:hypothetical protein